MLDLTPNYGGASVWFDSAAAVAERLKVSADKKRCVKSLSREGGGEAVHYRSKVWGHFLSV